jgi:hypothetical protein
VRSRRSSELALWVVVLVLLALLVGRGGPWLWPHLFPSPGGGDGGEEPATTSAAGEPLSPVEVAEVVHRTLVTLGLPGEGSASTIELPRGASARELELALRADPRLADAEVYVTRVDDLLWRLRVIQRGEVLLKRDVRPWLPERPVVSGSDPPELGLVVVFRQADEARVREVGRWKSPVALAMDPYAAHAVKSARQATWSSKEVVALVDPAQDLAEQLASAPDAAAVLLEGALPEEIDPAVWLDPLVELRLALIDARTGEPGELRRAAWEAGIPYLRRAGDLGEPGGAVLARNRSVRRGYGVITADGTEAGLAALEAFVEQARADGYSIVFPAEVAGIHGERRAIAP